jgi:conjugal transfer pilus assembly protein TraB
MIDKLKNRWAQIPSNQKRTVVLTTVLTAIIALSLVGYYIKSKSGEIPQGRTTQGNKEIVLDSRLLEKSAYLETQKEIAKTEEKLSLFRKELDEIREQKEKTNLKEEKHPSPPVPKVSVPEKSSRYPVTPLPPPPQPPASTTGASPSGQAAKGTAETVGDIELVSNPQSQGKDPKQTDVKKNEKADSVYLPPSFMEATLLSGLDAPTVESAKGNPVPVLLRIKDLAILPNRVKADLKGCFVIAEGHGNLADERAHLRLTNLSCLSRKGQAVIDQKVKGFVVDSDGKIGLRGAVVSRMGSAIARSVLAGFFGGVGDAVKSSAVTSSVSALGTTQTIDPGQVAQAGLGSGLAQGAHELQKFYLELAKQSMPVIEVGATRNITLVVSEGVELEIKEKPGGKKHQ